MHGSFESGLMISHRKTLRTSEARRIDLAASPELQPRRRTLGTGLPGYQAGWFRLKGGEKADPEAFLRRSSPWTGDR